MRSEAAHGPVQEMDVWDKLVMGLAVGGCLIVGWAAFAWGV